MAKDKGGDKAAKGGDKAAKGDAKKDKDDSMKTEKFHADTVDAAVVLMQ